MPALENHSELRQLATAVRNRDQFAATFDQVARGRTPFTFKVLALLQRDAPYLKAFMHAAEKDFLDPLVDGLMHAGVLDFEQIAPEAPPPGLTAHMQAVTRRDLGFMNVALETQGKLTAMRRVCCITILKSDRATPLKVGTGFLVGPQIVMTSYHLIKELVDNDGNGPAVNSDRIRVAFDQIDGMRLGSVVPVQTDWLANRSRVHPLEEETAGPLDWDRLPEVDFDKHLDFALLRLSLTVGRERGYYGLDPTRMPVTGQTGAMVALLQHPDGFPLASSTGAALKLWPPTYKTRLHHDANSADGSSGGLLVDSEFKPIGLHQCSYRDAQNKPLFNGAIPTACIARLNLPLADVHGFDPIWTLSDTNEPVVGREDFQQSVLRAIQGQKPILTVAGNTKMGRSFTTRILREMLGTAEHHIVELSAVTLQVTARATAATLLAAMAGTPAAAPALPDTNEAETAQAAWISSELLPSFSRALADIAGHRTVWLVIDDVDRYPVANTSTRVFLETLYAGIGSLPQLRVVLIGFQGAVPGAAPGQVEPESLREFNVIELKQYIDRESTTCKIPRRPDETLAIAQQLLDNVPFTQGSRQAELARQAADAARRQ